jgi:CheY-like chemotaxis protein
MSNAEKRSKGSPAKEIASSGGKLTGCGETILLVEDDQMLRSLIAMSLECNGYKVIEAGNGLEAMRKWEQHGGTIDLVFTDMVMPGGMTGLDVIERLRSLQPNVRSIVSSGYSLDLGHSAASEGRAFASCLSRIKHPNLPKPFGNAWTSPRHPPTGKFVAEAWGLGAPSCCCAAAIDSPAQTGAGVQYVCNK